MKIQLINSSKLKIILNKIDLDENNISLHSFLSRSSISQKFLEAIIEIAYEDLGFNIKNKTFTYEIYCFDFLDFIVIIKPNSDFTFSSNTYSKLVNYSKKNFSRDNHITNNFSFKFSQNELIKSENLFFFFYKFDDFLSFSEFIKNNIKFKNIDSILYKYKNIFLLEIITSNLLKNELNLLVFNILEAYSPSTVSKLTLIRFKEFSEILFSENALNL